MIPGIFGRCKNCKRLLLLPYFTGSNAPKKNMVFYCSECVRNHYAS